MSSIDDIWAEMQAEEERDRAERAARSRNVAPLSDLSAVIATPSTTTTTATISSSKSTSASTTAAAAVEKVTSGVGELTLKASDVEKITKRPEQITPGNVQQKINCLSDEAVSVRRAALEGFLALSFADEMEGDDMETVFGRAGKALIQSFSDPNERNRDTAIRSVIQFVERGVDVSDVLADIARTILDRSSSEPSDTVRLLLLLLQSRLITVAASSCTRYVQHFLQVILNLAEDENPEVRKEACHCTILLCSCMAHLLEPHAEGLARAFFASLAHKHARVRLAAISCVGSLLLAGGSKSIPDLVAYQAPNVIPIADFFPSSDRMGKINYLALLCIDANASVRDALLSMLLDCTMNLVDRLDYQPKLLPYVFNALTDEIPAISSRAFEGLQSLGLQIEREREEELRDSVSYALTAPTEINARERWRNRKHRDPLSGRPNLGARLLARDLFPKVVKTIGDELDSWQDDVKSHSGALLYYLIAFTESYATGSLPTVISALSRFMSAAFSSDSAEMTSDARRDVLIALETMELIGEFCQVEATLSALLPVLARPPSQLSARMESTWKSVHLAMTAAFVRGAGPKRLSLSDVDTISSAVAAEFLEGSGDVIIVQQVAAVLLELGIKAKDDVDLSKNPSCAALALRLLAACIVNCQPPSSESTAIQTPLLPKENVEIWNDVWRIAVHCALVFPLSSKVVESCLEVSPSKIDRVAIGAAVTVVSFLCSQTSASAQSPYPRLQSSYPIETLPKIPFSVNESARVLLPLLHEAFERANIADVLSCTNIARVCVMARITRVTSLLPPLSQFLDRNIAALSESQQHRTATVLRLQRTAETLHDIADFAQTSHGSGSAEDAAIWQETLLALLRVTAALSETTDASIVIPIIKTLACLPPSNIDPVCVSLKKTLGDHRRAIRITSVAALLRLARATETSQWPEAFRELVHEAATETSSDNEELRALRRDLAASANPTHTS